MLHDRSVPGTRGNIDHIIVAPGGVFVVDAKNHSGRIRIRDQGGLFRADHRLTIAGRDCTAMADKMGWQVDAVARVRARADLASRVVPVLSFLNVGWPLVGAPAEFRGVRLESHRSMSRLLTMPAVLDGPQVAALADRLAAALPPR